MSELKCKICGNIRDNELITLQERQFGAGDRFEYIVCSRCKCIQIREIPLNIARYYHQEYYAFDKPVFPSKLNPVNYYLKKSLIKHYMGYPDPAGFFLSLVYDHPFPWIRKGEISFNSRILDVGTGSGRKLLSLSRSGFKNLTGIDPFISGDIIYENGVTILKKDISDAAGVYDCITLHHSFEHMPEPWNVVKHISRLLDNKGVAVIRIPVADSHAWYKYGEFWVGLDAPRHFFIHTRMSLAILLEETDLVIDDVVFDSGPLQFIRSEKYRRGLPMSAPDDFISKSDYRKYSKEAKELNRTGRGDMAVFYLKKKQHIAES